MIHIFLIASAIFLILDSSFIYLVSKSYNRMIQKIQGTPFKLNTFYTVLAYIALIIMINYFIIREKRSVGDAFLLGMLTYAIYAFTNGAIITNWEPQLILVDLLWGGTLYGLTTYLTYKVI